MYHTENNNSNDDTIKTYFSVSNAPRRKKNVITFTDVPTRGRQ